MKYICIICPATFACAAALLAACAAQDDTGGGVCPAGRVQCGSECVDTSSDRNNCGRCACSWDEYCSGGYCYPYY